MKTIIRRGIEAEIVQISYLLMRPRSQSLQKEYGVLTMCSNLIDWLCWKGRFHVSRYTRNIDNIKRENCHYKMRLSLWHRILGGAEAVYSSCVEEFWNYLIGILIPEAEGGGLSHTLQVERSYMAGNIGWIWPDSMGSLPYWEIFWRRDCSEYSGYRIWWG